MPRKEKKEPRLWCRFWDALPDSIQNHFFNQTSMSTLRTIIARREEKRNEDFYADWDLYCIILNVDISCRRKAKKDFRLWCWLWEPPRKGGPISWCRQHREEENGIFDELFSGDFVSISFGFSFPLIFCALDVTTRDLTCYLLMMLNWLDSLSMNDMLCWQYFDILFRRIR